MLSIPDSTLTRHTLRLACMGSAESAGERLTLAPSSCDISMTRWYVARQLRARLIDKWMWKPLDLNGENKDPESQPENRSIPRQPHQTNTNSRRITKCCNTVLTRQATKAQTSSSQKNTKKQKRQRSKKLPNKVEATHKPHFCSECVRGVAVSAAKAVAVASLCAATSGVSLCSPEEQSVFVSHSPCFGWEKVSKEERSDKTPELPAHTCSVRKAAHARQKAQSRLMQNWELQ